MGLDTGIEWAHDTLNFWIGCDERDGHPACAHCYARKQAAEWLKRVVWGDQSEGGTRRVTSPNTFRKSRLYSRAAEQSGKRRRVFVNSWSDFFEDWPGPMLDHSKTPRVIGNCPFCGAYALVDGNRCGSCTAVVDYLWTMADVRREALCEIDLYREWLDYLLLTKRPENIARMLKAAGSKGYRENVWLGTTVSNQKTANELIPPLVEAGNYGRFTYLSIEPLLGPIDLTPWLEGSTPSIDWVIVGGESGDHARPTHPDWIRSIREQCVAHGVAFFFKQWGEWAPADLHPLKQVGDRQAVRVVKRDGGDRIFAGNGKFTGESPTAADVWMARVGKEAAGRVLDGREWSEFPDERVAL